MEPQVNQANQALIQNIKQWLEIEQRISHLGRELRELRKTKKELSVSLMEVMKTNEIDCFDCNSGQLTYTKNNVKKSINKKYLNDVLTQYFEHSDQEEAEKLCNFILDNRAIQVRENIKLKKKK